MAYLINDQTGEAVEIPEGESTVGRGPLLKVSLAGVMAWLQINYNLLPRCKDVARAYFNTVSHSAL